MSALTPWTNTPVYNPNNISFGFDEPVEIDGTNYRITSGSPVMGSKQMNREDGEGLPDGFVSVVTFVQMSGELQLPNKTAPFPKVHGEFLLAFQSMGAEPQTWVILSVTEQRSNGDITKCPITCRLSEVSATP